MSVRAELYGQPFDHIFSYLLSKQQSIVDLMRTQIQSLKNILIRRDLQPCPLPAYFDVDLPKFSSTTRIKWRR